MLRLRGVLCSRCAACGSALHRAGQNVAAAGGGLVPVKKQLGGDRGHLLSPHVDIQRITTRLCLLQSSEQRCAIHRLGGLAVQLLGEVNLVVVALRNAAVDGLDHCFKLRIVQATFPR